QLNRNIEQEKNREPRLSDIRESGSIEQDADLIAFLYKKKFDKEEGTDEPDVIPVNLLIAKQRNGPTGTCYLTLFKSYTRFENASVIDEKDVPQRESQQEFRAPTPPEE